MRERLPDLRLHAPLAGAAGAAATARRGAPVRARVPPQAALARAHRQRARRGAGRRPDAARGAAEGVRLGGGVARGRSPERDRDARPRAAARSPRRVAGHLAHRGGCRVSAPAAVRSRAPRAWLPRAPRRRCAGDRGVARRPAEGPAARRQHARGLSARPRGLPGASRAGTRCTNWNEATQHVRRRLLRHLQRRGLSGGTVTRRRSHAARLPRVPRAHRGARRTIRSRCCRRRGASAGCRTRSRCGDIEALLAQPAGGGAAGAARPRHARAGVRLRAARLRAGRARARRLDLARRVLTVTGKGDKQRAGAVRPCRRRGAARVARARPPAARRACAARPRVLQRARRRALPHGLVEDPARSRPRRRTSRRTSTRTRCGTRSPRTCSRAARTCVSCRNCSGTRLSPPPPSTRTSTGATCARCTGSSTRGPDGPRSHDRGRGGSDEAQSRSAALRVTRHARSGPGHAAARGQHRAAARRAGRRRHAGAVRRPVRRAGDLGKEFGFGAGLVVRARLPHALRARRSGCRSRRGGWTRAMPARESTRRRVPAGHGPDSLACATALTLQTLRASTSTSSSARVRARPDAVGVGAGLAKINARADGR